MRTLRKPALAVIGALVAASPLLAHHDWPVDRTRQVTVTGTVTAYTWANPHVTIGLDVEGGRCHWNRLPLQEWIQRGPATEDRAGRREGDVPLHGPLPAVGVAVFGEPR